MVVVYYGRHNMVIGTVRVWILVGIVCGWMGFGGLGFDFVVAARWCGVALGLPSVLYFVGLLRYSWLAWVGFGDFGGGFGGFVFDSGTFGLGWRLVGGF